MKGEVKRWFFSVVICAFLMFLFVNFNAVAADVSSLTVKFIGENCIVADCDEKAEGVLVIPSEISGIPVTIIDEGAFSKCKLLTEIVLPDTVVEVCNSAFSGCTGLCRFTIPDSVRSFGQGVFSQCKSLRTVKLSENFISVPKDTFYMCTSLENINLPQKLKVVGENAFFGCSNLKSIILSEGVTELLPRSFSNCSSLETVYIPSSLGIIGVDAFEKCGLLNTVYYGATQKEFESLAVSDGNTCLEFADYEYNHDHIGSAEVTIVKATCSQPGYSTFNCPCGYEFQGDFLPATGHSLTVIQTVKQADCISNGIEYHKCENCDYYETEAVSPKGHNIVADKAVEATCTLPGKTEGSHCSFCNMPSAKQIVTMPLGHDFTMKVKDSKHLASNPTYKNAARYYYTCSRCNKISDDKTFEGEKLVLPKVKKISFSSTASTVTLKWSEVASARGYAVYQKDKKGKWTLIERVRTNSIKLEKLSAGTILDFAVRAYVKEDDGLVYAPEYTSLKAVTKPLPVTKLTAKQNNKAITLNWKKSKGATGYRVYRYDSNSKKWKIICSYTENNKLTIKGLQSGQKYKLSVRACIDTGKELVWSKRSDSIITCTKPVNPVAKATAYKNSVKLQWDKVKFADGYVIYASTDPNSGYKKVKTTKKLSCKIEKLKSKKNYYFKVYSYRNLSDGKVYSYASQIKKVKTR